MKSRLIQRYHWVVAIVAMIEFAIFGGLINNYSSLYIIPVTETLNISRGSFSLALNCKSIVAFFSIMLSGFFVSRLDSKKMMILGLCIGAISYTVSSQSQGVAAVAAASALMGLCDGLCATTTVSRVIGDWFHRYQGTILGLVGASSGIGGSLAATALSGVIGSSGWRTAYLVSALLLAAAGVLVLLLLRSRPDNIGLMPYGFGYQPKKINRRADHWEGFSMEELFRRPSFYLMLLATLLSTFSIYLAFHVIIPHMQGRGLTQAEAAAQQSTMMIVMAVSKIIYGFLCDKIGTKWVVLLCMVLSVTGLWALTGVTDTNSASVAVLLYSMSLPMTTVLPPLLASSLFGYRSISASLGIIMAMPSLSSLAASPISNLVYDKTGSYNPAFRFAAILGIVTLALFALLFFLAARGRKMYNEVADTKSN